MTKAEAAKPARGTPRRLAAAPSASLRVRCAARVRGPAGNSLRSLRSLRSDTPALKSVHYAGEYARGPRTLRCSAPQMRAAAHPEPALLQPTVAREGIQPPHATVGGLRGRRHPPGAISVAARSAGPGSARAQRVLRELTHRSCLSAVSEANVASSAMRPWTEHRSGVGAKRRPPQHEPLAGAACRDALKERTHDGLSRTAARSHVPSFTHIRSTR
jgi:hypothetical protein